MQRIGYLVVALAVVACKKPKKEDPPESPPGPPKVGHSVTKVNDGDAAGSGSAVAAKGDAGVPDAPPQIGGNGQAAYRDEAGHVHGPGGPVFMGRGADCDAAHDHCIRKDVWFSVGNIVPGRLYRAVPVYLFESKWYTWRGDADEPIKLYKTQLAGKAALSSGTPVIWFSDETDSKKWADSEYEALTSSRWEAGVVDTPSSNGKVKIKGWNDVVPMDTVRTIVEVKSP